ncbi:DUF6602 domain-containing protein [Burkholderia cenocepacia]|uniref:DUF6602 domain-containing protein n=1 Tax=Burkholderia cenocepacia TaxID=95486 RepID=UPI00222E86C6|nr:DUF6602 domain-containing protein [Burkholderia cenocepacia]MCW3610652.1 hypothetical protein [Burkholderia cenocepacia]MCW5191687.1 hypothetical protein [Burkholderia cenocepacia]
MAQTPVDVRQLLTATAASLWATFLDSAAHARPDHKGGPREARVRQFLRERLPTKWGVTHGHVFRGDVTSPEFDVLVYDALNCPGWTLDAGDDPRRLVPLDAVIGVIEVKSTLDYRTLAAAVDKLAQLDAALAAEAAQNGPAEYAPFRHVFAYRLDPDDDFDGWRRPGYALTRYAGAHTQPDGIFVLDSHFSVRVNGHGIAHAFGLHRGQTPEEIWNSTYDLQNESIQRDLQLDPSYCNDYFTTEAKDGLLLLAFLTYVIQRASRYEPAGVDYADEFCRWGGPALGGLLNFRSPPDPDCAALTVPQA